MLCKSQQWQNNNNKMQLSMLTNINETCCTTKTSYVCNMKKKTIFTNSMFTVNLHNLLLRYGELRPSLI